MIFFFSFDKNLRWAGMLLTEFLGVFFVSLPKCYNFTLKHCLVTYFPQPHVLLLHCFNIPQHIKKRQDGLRRSSFLVLPPGYLLKLSRCQSSHTKGQKKDHMKILGPRDTANLAVLVYLKLFTSFVWGLLISQWEALKGSTVSWINHRRRVQPQPFQQRGFIGWWMKYFCFQVAGWLWAVGWRCRPFHHPVTGIAGNWSIEMHRYSSLMTQGCSLYPSTGHVNGVQGEWESCLQSYLPKISEMVVSLPVKEKNNDKEYKNVSLTGFSSFE